MDITDVSVLRLRAEFPQQVFTTASISSPEFVAPGSFDIVNVWDVLYHVVDEEGFGVALRNLARCVRPGGRLLLTDQLAGAGDVTVAPHVRFRCLGSYQRSLPEEGIHLVKLLPLYFRLNNSQDPDQEKKAADYYAFDSRTELIAARNLVLGIWQRPPV
jgi:SAM-dependent methyltransferase